MLNQERASDPPRDDAARALAEARLIHQLCERFETAWRRGERPRAEDSLTELPGPPPSKLVAPFWIVKPRSTAPRVSPELKTTTDPARLPSMIVTAGPLSLATVMALPRNVRFSR